MPKTPIAVFCGDIHLTLNPPACRKEKDWLEVQAGYLKQLKDIAGDAPVMCSGDLFDKWNPMPELIHFALGHLPDGMICIPGNHDLPLHSIDLMHRSAYGVLERCGKIIDLSDMPHYDGIKGAVVWGFGCGQEFVSPNLRSEYLQIALIHHYCWLGKDKYPGAAPTDHVFSMVNSWKGYDVVSLGDNHQNWHIRIGGKEIINPGTFIKRKTDEIKYTPSVGILLQDGTVETHRLDTSKDQFHESTHKGETMLDVSKFIHELKELGEHGLDFRAAVENHLKSEDVDPAVKQIILEALA